MTELTGMIDSLKGKLVVSVQAYPGEPMRDPRTMALIAAAAELGGAAAIRCQGLGDITAIKGQVSVPVIGLWKEGKDGVFITPTLRHARACSAAGADIVALDATRRPRPDGLTYAVIVAAEKAWDEITLSSGVEGDLGTLGHQGASPEVINALSPADDPRFGVSPNGHRRITLWRNRCLGNAAARLLPA